MGQRSFAVDSPTVSNSLTPRFADINCCKWHELTAVGQRSFAVDSPTRPSQTVLPLALQTLASSLQRFKRILKTHFQLLTDCKKIRLNCLKLDEGVTVQSHLCCVVSQKLTTHSLLTLSTAVPVLSWLLPLPTKLCNESCLTVSWIAVKVVSGLH